MGEYAYTGRNRAGKTISGTITAKSEKEAKNMLFNKGLVPIKIKAKAIEEGKRVLGIFRVDAHGQLEISFGSGMPNPKELAIFTKQFSMLIENGVPMMQSLNLLADQQKKHGFKRAIEDVSKSISEGSSLFLALAKYPQIFDSLYISMIRAGEASGRLDVILRQLVNYVEKAAKIKSQIKSAMMYPVIIMVVAIGVVVALLTFVVPTMAKQFKESGKELPGITQFIIDASDLLASHWHFFLGGIVVAFFFFKRWVKTDLGRKQFDTILLKTPIIGDVLKKIAIGRFCSTMSTMLSSGVSILEALDICATAAGNKQVEGYVLGMKEEIARGRSFAEPMSEIPLFPKMVSSMVAVGESTGTLDSSLFKINLIYEEEVDQAIATMTSLIEPLMIVFIGGTVGFIVIAMYLPIFDMASTSG